MVWNISLTYRKRYLIFTNFEYNSTGFSVKGIIDNLINDFLEIAINIQRADKGGVGDYLIEMKHNFEIRFIMA